MPEALKFRAVKRPDQRVAFRYAQAQPAQSRPLDHRGVASAVFLFFLTFEALPEEQKCRRGNFFL